MLRFIFILCFGLWFAAPSFAALQVEISGITDRTYVDFGFVRIGDTAYRNVRLTNTGTTVVTDIRMSISGYTFRGVNYCPRDLWPNQTCSVSVDFRPYSEGSFYGTLYVDAANAATTVSLSGWGTRW